MNGAEIFAEIDTGSRFLSNLLKKIITFFVRELRWTSGTFTHIIIIFSRTEGKYLPQDKGQVKDYLKKIPVRALKTKIMS